MEIWNRVELKIQEMVRGVSGQDMYILILREVGGPRKLPLLLSEREAQIVVDRMMQRTKGKLTLVDTMLKMTSVYGIIVDDVTIYGANNGSYQAKLSMFQCGQLEQITISAADAVIIAMTYRCPVYIDPQLLDVVPNKKGAGLVALPMSMLTVELLEEALQRAVEEENYELASQLRDEIKRRQ